MSTLCWRSTLCPLNLYGPNDNYDLENSHVLPALLRKFITAKRNQDTEVTIWGSGSPLREFLHVDDLAEAYMFLMRNYNEQGIVNVGVGVDLSILELANMIKSIVGFDGSIVFDSSRPDGTPQKLMDVTKLTNLGWKAVIGLQDGINRVYQEIKNMDWD